ncbi:MAG: hypothetical protein KGI90_02885 [Burkholderiales bacterium]|nr:hypothetical protein [Burkholderiales bacterium]MDE2275442.1 hypothetical protein [Burkholderiales bacterium]
MKRLPVATALAAPMLLALLAVQPARAADVGVSVSISQPGVYGRIDIGRFPQPELVLQQPVLIQAPVVPVQPVYMWVPPGQRQHWARYCGQYRACGVPVYFVRDQWYEQRVRPHEHDHDERRPDWRRDRHEDRGDRGDHGDRGRGHGRGHGGDRGGDHGGD